MIGELSLDRLSDIAAQLAAAGLATKLRAAPAAGQRHRLFLKPENLQPTGSFKIRGATAAIARLPSETRHRGVVAYSTGNHAQAVAFAARQAGIPATIVMSPDAPADKIAQTRRHGAEIMMAEPNSQARRDLAETHAADRGLALIPPYDDHAVMRGQASIGLEILAECSPAAIIVPIGGGGLIAGIAAAVKQASPATRIIGVEPELENDAWQSFRADTRIALPGPSTSIADAIKVQVLGEHTFPLIRDYVDDILLVTEQEILAAMPFAETHTGGPVEPAGALAVAACLSGRLAALPPGTIVAVVSGGNIAPDRRDALLRPSPPRPSA